MYMWVESFEDLALHVYKIEGDKSLNDGFLLNATYMLFLLIRWIRVLTN